MTAAARERHDLTRWVVSGAVVLGLHAAGFAGLMRWQVVSEGDEGTEVVMVDLAPYTEPTTTPSNQDIAPGPLQQEAAPPTEPQPDRQEETTEQKIDLPPPAPNPEVVLPQQTPKAEPPPKEQPAPAAPIATAPPPPRPSRAQVTSWHRSIALQLERHKGYPASARSRHQTGVVQVSFVINRTGHVVSSRIVQSSGVAALDQETLATVQRAQPFPLPPPNMPGQTFDFTVPIRFNIR